MHTPNTSRDVRNRRSAWLLLILLALVPATATAQEPGDLSEQTEQNEDPTGIIYRGFRLSPELYLEGSYDSNVFSRDQAEGGADGGIIIPGARFAVETLEPKSVDLRASTFLAGEIYLAEEEAVGAQSGVEAGLDLSAHFSPKSTFSVQPSVSYQRSNNPQYSFSEESYNEDLFDLGLDVFIQPYEGKIFSQKIGYDFNYHLLEEIEDLNRQVHRLRSKTRWNFLFQTALLLNVDWSVNLYDQSARSVQTREGQRIGFELTNVDSSPLRVNAGLSTLLWNRVYLSLLAGYGYTFYDSGANSHEPLITAVLGYQWSKNSKLDFTYTKNFSDSSFGNFYSFHRFALSFSKTFFSRFTTHLTARVDARDYAPVEQLSARSDVVLDSEAGIEYRFIKGFHAGIRYQLMANFTNFALAFPNEDGSRGVMFASYTKHLLFVNLNYRF